MLSTLIPPSPPAELRRRFTLDGSDALEECLAELCRRAAYGVREVLPAARLEAFVLGGGYGRGQGGVLRTQHGDAPYNDLEFYVFAKGNRWLNERRFGPGLARLAEALSPAAGLDVEFKIDSLAQLRRRPISMFSHDLVSGHRVLFGGPAVFRGCERHFRASDLPLSEATRLLLNRCTGLLLAKEMLEQPHLGAEEMDFIGRNLAKAQLALGDAVLAAAGRYHSSCLERQERLERLTLSFPPPGLSQIQRHHALGVAFKLRPRRVEEPAAQFRAELDELSALCARVWLWLESRRLRCGFANPWEYAGRRILKCPGSRWWRNWLLNLRTFGPRAALDRYSWRYPRERLFNALPLLLWQADLSAQAEVIRYLQKQLHADAADWLGLVAAYKRIWPGYA